MHKLAYSLLFSWVLGTLAGCGDGAVATPDAGGANARLDILEPPGDDIGLTYGERVTLQVRYQNELDEVIVGAPVEFAMIATGAGENTAGSTLSSAVAYTDTEGMAAVDLVAGAQEASFRVRVDARDAPTRYFYVTISNGGFARLFITPVHQGWRAEEELAGIEVRLYRASALTCADLDIDDPPVSLSPPRSLDGFGGTVDYQNVMVGQPRTVIAWTRAAGQEVPLSAGCVDLGSSQLPNGRVYFDLAVRDRRLVVSEAPTRVELDLGPVAERLDAAGALRPWQVLACEAGPGQLLVDCALDAAAPDSALDCRVEGTGSLVTDLAARRGAPDASGCRPALLGDGSASVDAVITAAAGDGFPTGQALAELVQARRDIAGRLVLDSQISLPEGSSAARHRLSALRAASAAGEHVLELGATSRPLIEQAPVAAALEGDALTLAEHGFSLRYGSFAAEAFVALGLEPHGLAGAGDALGTALAQSVTSETASGCAALSALACTDIGRAEDCLAAACQQGSAALDGLMTAWWRALVASGQDFALAGTAVAHDADGDRVAESVGRDAEGAVTAQWSATLWLEDGAAVDVTSAP